VERVEVVHPAHVAAALGRERHPARSALAGGARESDQQVAEHAAQGVVAVPGHRHGDEVVRGGFQERDILAGVVQERAN